MSAIEDDIRGRMMSLLKSEEDKTDLTGLSVISRVGMKVATAFSAEVDADAVPALRAGEQLAERGEDGVLDAEGAPLQRHRGAWPLEGGLGRDGLMTQGLDRLDEAGSTCAGEEVPDLGLVLPAKAIGQSWMKSEYAAIVGGKY